MNKTYGNGYLRGILSVLAMLFVMVTYQGCSQPTSLKQSFSSEDGLDNNPDDSAPTTPSEPEEPPVSYPDNPVPADATVTIIASNHRFTEGPAYRKETNELYFSDLNFQDPSLDAVYALDLETMAKRIWKSNANGSNGNMFDSNGVLFTLEGRTQRRVVRHQNFEDSTDITPYPNVFEGRLLNAPNDLDIHPDGSIFFTDPTYNTDTTDTNPLPFRGVFRQSTDGTLTALIRNGFVQPNGIVFSPDYLKLYVADSEADQLWSFDVINGGTSLANGGILYAPATPTPDGVGNMDGITMDVVGNIYLSGAAQITVVNPQGAVLDTIPVGERTTNCTFGGPDNTTLFITAETTVRAVPLLIPGK